MTAQKTNQAKKGIDKLIQEHNELFSAWRSHRSKADYCELDAEGDVQMVCESQTGDAIELK